MGRKQKKLWQHILLFPASCLIILNVIIGCQVPVEPPGLPQQQIEAGKLPETRSKDTATNLDRLEAQLLNQADESIKNGEIIEALQLVAQAISCCKGQLSGRTSNTIRIILAHPEYRLDNQDHALSCLRQLEAKFPKPGYDPTAGCWLTGLSEILTKETKIQKMKNTIRSQAETIQTLKKQTAQLKAVDLEPVQPETAVEVP
jgi:hypothetical protein